jgi:hypothetical protein
MTNYISSINGLSLLQDIKEDDNLFLVIHEDDLKNISLDTFEKILDLKSVFSQFDLRKYTVLSERDLAIVAPIFQDEKSDFVLVDEDFPDFHYFGDRVSKFNKGKIVKKTAVKSKKATVGGGKISGEPVKTAPAIKDTKKKIFPDKFELDAKDREITATFDNAPQGDSAQKPTTKTQEEVDAHKRVQLAKDMKELLKLNPKKYGCSMGDDVFNLMIARVFKKANNDEEIEAGILALDYGELLWEKVSPHAEEIKKLVQ